MKPATSQLLAYLNAARSGDGKLLMADAFQFLLTDGTVLAYTNIDVTFTYSGVTYLANSILINGLKYKSAVGLETDSQQITIASRLVDTIPGGAPFMQALRAGAFDGSEIVRYRVFFSDRLGGTVVGAAMLFKGRLGKIDEIGRTSAALTVNSDLMLLSYDMPRNLYQPTCVHTLYDSGCTMLKASFKTSGAAGAGSSQTVINWSGAASNFVQGTISFTSGDLSGVTAMVGSAVAGVSLNMIDPLEAAPVAGDTFDVYFGCDHTMATCQAKFNNLINFRGFPFVPPAQMAV